MIGPGTGLKIQPMLPKPILLPPGPDAPPSMPSSHQDVFPPHFCSTLLPPSPPLGLPAHFTAHSEISTRDLCQLGVGWIVLYIRLRAHPNNDSGSGKPLLLALHSKAKMHPLLNQKQESWSYLMFTVQRAAV